MKKILLAAAVAIIAALALANNDTEASQQAALVSIYDQVIQGNAAAAVQSCQSWQQQLQAATPGERSADLDQGFKQLLLGWKKVEATYIAGDLMAEAIDYPRYIDIFHIGNEDIGQQMQKVLRSQSAPEAALFKHSYKTINALEAVLYQDQQLNPRKLAVSQVISNNICQRLQQIRQTYADKRGDFLSQQDKALSMLVNTLANQTFTLKEWRIGDVVGLSKRYQGKPDPRRSEYYLSGLSMSAVQAILATQDQLIGTQAYANFAQVAAAYAAEKPLQESRQLLANARAQAAQLDKPGFDFNPQTSQPLYQNINRLQNSYYSNLIHALPVVAKILEADGD